MKQAAWKPKGTFSHHWFANLTARLWQQFVLPHFAKHEGPLNYLEVGVAEGQSLLFALEHFGRPGGLFVGIDPFLPSRNWKPEEGNQHRDRALDNLSIFFGSKPDRQQSFDDGRHWFRFVKDRLACEIFPQPSGEHLRREQRQFDVVYIDGNHDAPHAMLDVMLGFNLLREGGLLIVDDYERYMRGGRPQVKPTCDAFEMIFWGYWDCLYRHPKQVCYEKVRRRRRGEYPPMMVRGPVVSPAGDTG